LRRNSILKSSAFITSPRSSWRRQRQQRIPRPREPIAKPDDEDGETSAFVAPEIQAIDDKRWEEFLRAPVLEPWRIQCTKSAGCARTFFRARRTIARTRSAAMDGYDDAFSQLTNVDMKFGVLIDADGHEKPLTQSTYSSFY